MLSRGINLPIRLASSNVGDIRSGVMWKHPEFTGFRFQNVTQGKVKRKILLHCFMDPHLLVKVYGWIVAMHYFSSGEVCRRRRRRRLYFAF